MDNGNLTIFRKIDRDVFSANDRDAPLAREFAIAK